MTKKRNDNHSTEFGLWLREQSSIDSKIGYIATNVDFVWRNYNTEEWLYLEEKRYKAGVEWWQEQVFKVVDKSAQHDTNYKGFYILTFEKSSPDDGRIKIKRIEDNNSVEITKDELLYFLKNMRLP